VIAAQLVVIGHAIAFFFATSKYHFIQEASVLVFFILSGLVISYSVKIKYNRDNNYNFKEFFIERFARIYSGLFPSLIFILLIDIIHIYYFSFPYNPKYDFDLLSLFGNLFMLQNYPYLHHIISIGPFGSGRPLWSLCVEWWFYMTYGIIVFYFYKQFSYTKLLYLLVLLVVPIYYILGGTGGGLTIYWLMGVVIMILLFENKMAINKESSLFFIFLFLVLSVAWINETKTAYHPLFASMIAIFILFSLNYLNQVNIYIDMLKFKKIIHFFASYSLTLYLVHYSILDLLRNFINNENKFSIIIFSIVLTNVLACCLALKTEMKYKVFALYLKNNFLKRNYSAM
jgi:peptidoglycan/LPS O-acetylase OafA/YrhL